MSILNVSHLSHGFGDREILKDVSFRIENGEHIGLIGPNGEGKTTFINVIVHKLLPDSGKIEWSKRAKVGYLDQYTELEPGKTVRDILRMAFDDSYKLEKEMLEDYDKMATADEKEMESLMNDVGEIQSILDHSGFYLIETKIEEIANGMGLNEIGLDSDVSELSGGQRSKVLLTKLLLENPTILLLDEPTNFLDEGHIRWLKNYLLNYENAFVLISHDLEFLNSVVNIVYHLENGVMERYTGDYESFVKQHEIKQRQQEDKYKAQQKQIEDMKDFIARNKARVSTRGMANSVQKRLDKMDVIEKGREKIKPNIRFPMAKLNPGRIAYDLQQVVIGYDHALSTPIDLEIKRGEKIAFYGINGIGKSTLLKTIMGVIPAISGNIKRSDNISLGYFEQEVKSPNKSAFNEIWDNYPYLNIGEVRSALAACGLFAEQIDSLVLALSGGEQAKVRLCKLTIEKTNIIVLDEPTNHLDELAKEALKVAIRNYEGTILFVSHDPNFYNDVATRTINVERYSLIK